MVSIQTKYIILFWIIILILFTFYCVIRMGYLREKYGNTEVQTQNTQPNIISYINDIEKKKDITDMPGCSDIYDDDEAVKYLGYDTCQNAYSDYLLNKKDVTTKQPDQSQSLMDICPVSTKSEKYSQCLQSLINTFTDNANMLDIINADMTTSINQRISDRSNDISGIQTSLNPFMYSKSQVDFNNNMQMNGQVANYKDDKLGLVNQYYQTRYRGGLEGFSNIPTSTVTSSSSSLGSSIGSSVPADLSILILDPNLIKNFFGTYQSVPGQFKSLSNLTITIGYDTSNGDTQSITIGDTIEQVPLPILLSIDNGSLKIDYTVSYIENYKTLPNAIKLNLTDKNIVTDTNQNQDQSAILQQLLSILGINIPARLIMTYEEFTSTEYLVHRSYKLVNDNLDTLLILNKIK